MNLGPHSIDFYLHTTVLIECLCTSSIDVELSSSYDDLKKIFGRYGRIVDITLPLDYYTRDAKGYGFVEYEESRDAGE